MALKIHFPEWLKRLLVGNAAVQRQHDALEESFTELEADFQQMTDDSCYDLASTAGLVRLGRELDEPRLPGQSNAQYAARLKQIKQGDMLTDPAIRDALDRWDMAYTLIEDGDPGTFYDQDTYWDQNAYAVGRCAFLIVFADPFPGGPPSPTQKAAALQAINNAVNDVRRIKARGVNVPVFLPASLA